MNSIIKSFKKAEGVFRTLLLGAVCLAGMGLMSCGGDKVEAPKPEVRVFKVTKQDVPVYSEYVGQTIGSLDIAIRARVDGTLEGMHFKEGSEVKKGDSLYTIDSRPFESKVVEAQGIVAEAQAGLTKADNDLARIRPLAKINAVSKRDLDAAVAAKGAAEASLQAAEASKEFAEIERGYTKIVAPISGLIGISKAQVGDYVGKEPNPVVLNMVSQVDPIHVRVTISEREYLTFARTYVSKRAEAVGSKQGEAVRTSSNQKGKRQLKLLLADGTEHPEKGTLYAVNSMVDPETGTLTFELRFPNPDKMLRPGQFARVQAMTATKEGSLVVPERAVQELQGKYRVSVVDAENKVVIREIKKGPKAGEMVVLLSGVKEGEQVVVDGLQRIQPGMEVNPVEYQTEEAAPAQKK